MKPRIDDDKMKVFGTTKRKNNLKGWEPIYVGTNAEPFYDERLDWEGRADKMTQAYTLCLLDYNFNVLSNAFLVHKPGLKKVKQAIRQSSGNEIHIRNEILPEIKILYGESTECKFR